MIRSYIIGGIGVIALILAIVLSWFLDTDTFEKNDADPKVVLQAGQQILPRQHLPKKANQTQSLSQSSNTVIEEPALPEKSEASSILKLTSSAPVDRKPTDSQAKGMSKDIVSGQIEATHAGSLGTAHQSEKDVSFDVVRISPDGNAVLAGKSADNQILELYDGENLLGTTQSDEQGNWVFVPEAPLNVGQHHIVIKKRLDDQTVIDTGTDVLAVTIQAPKKDGQNQKPFAILLPQAPDKAVKLIQSPVENQTQELTDKQFNPSNVKLKTTDRSIIQSAPEIVKRSFPLQILQLDILSDGHWQIRGTGDAKSHLRYYLNSQYQDNFMMSQIGQSVEEGMPVPWSLSSQHPLNPGEHILRLDVVSVKGANVLERQEVILSYKADVGKKRTEAKLARSQPVLMETGRADSPNIKSAITRLQLAEKMPAGIPLDLSDVRVINIKTGDNLWTIARRTDGKGIVYTYIFNANQQQIVDPDLIYPGQIFVLPKIEDHQ